MLRMVRSYTCAAVMSWEPRSFMAVASRRPVIEERKKVRRKPVVMKGDSRWSWVWGDGPGASLQERDSEGLIDRGVRVALLPSEIIRGASYLGSQLVASILHRQPRGLCLYMSNQTANEAEDDTVEEHPWTST